MYPAVTAPSPLPPADPSTAALPQEARRLECLHCGAFTRHVMGRATYGAHGNLLVQWWTCAQCGEGETIP